MVKIKETKYNEWFRNVFLESFGLCKSKQISEKQGLIFERYLKEEEDNWRHHNAYYYSGIISGKMVRLQESSVFNGCTKGHTKTLYRTVYYITIQSDNTEEESELRAKIEKLDKLWNTKFDSNSEDAELDKIEAEIDSLQEKLNNLRFTG
jgi:hypothetical protein